MEIKKRVKAIIYARVSSKEQESEGYSIPAQINLLQDYAHTNNFHVTKIFKEAETAKKAGRTEFGVPSSVILNTILM